MALSSAGYNAVADSRHRTTPVTTSKSEDKILDISDRRKLVATARQQRRNHAILAWALRLHCDMVSRFTFQARTKDTAFNEALERLVRIRSLPRNCDVRGRWNLTEYMRILEMCRVVDGDVGSIFLRDGRLQGIEGDRIAYPTKGGLPADKYRDWSFTNGVHKAATDGHPLHYIVCNREAYGGTNRAGGSELVFDRMVNARNLYLLGYFDRFDQERGISPLSSSLNTVQDLAECWSFALQKMKLHAVLGVFFKRQAPAEADFGYNATDDDDDTNTAATYDFDIRGGAIKVEGLPGDDVSTFESRQPSEEFQSYSAMMIQDAIASLDIPITFWDSRRSSYVAQRQDLIRYGKSIKAKQDMPRAFLDQLTAWDISRWLAQTDAAGAPMLTLPSGISSIADVEWEWVPDGLSLLDPLKEVQAAGLAVSYGFTARDDICRKVYGNRFSTVAVQLGAEEALAEQESATIAIGQPGQITTRDEEAGNTANDTGDTPNG